MAGNGDCSMRQDWGDEKDEESLSPNHQEKVGQEHDKIRGNEAHYGQAKEKLEEELTRLTLIITENKGLLKNMSTCIQETDDELRLSLTVLRADLKRTNNDSMLREEVINWNAMEQRIITTLAELNECQNKIKLNYHLNAIYLGKLFKAITQMQMGQEEERVARPLAKCYYCHEGGHLWRECPHRINKERRMQTPVFKQKLAFRHKRNFDEMHGITSMTCPGKGSNDEDVRTMGQSNRENTIVSYNPLS